MKILKTGRFETHVNIMEQNWINYKIFVSSTFRDMDFERDVIRFRIIPELNDRYRPYRIQFQLVDLRVGINTSNLSEEEKENHVLNVCFNNIEQSRPFFIALLGDRYGWIPSDKRWETVFRRLNLEQQHLLSHSKGKSVTEMEILYGAIGNDGQYIDHSVFMVRSSRSYANMPPEIRSNYKDENEQQLNSLKQDILSTAAKKHEEANICYYDLEWDRAQNKFVRPDDFKTKLLARLTEVIDHEIAHIDEEEKTWQGQETKNAILQTEYAAQNSITTSFYQNLIRLIEQGRHQILISGDIGCGKSVLAAQSIEYLRKKGKKCCIATVGQTAYSRRMRDILYRWLYQLGSYETKIEALSNKQLYDLIRQRTEELRRAGEEVWFIIDGVEHFAEYNDDDVYQVWLWEEANVIMTAHPDYKPKIKHYHPYLTEITIDEWSHSDKLTLLDFYQRQGNMELPDKITERLISDGQSPLRIRMLMDVVCQLSISDFRTIRAMEEPDEMTKINNYLTSLVENAPRNFDDFVRYVFSILTDRMEASEAHLRLFRYIAASVVGLRESDMELLLGKEWDPLAFHSLAFILGDIMHEDHYSRLWTISNSVRNALLPRDKRDIYKELVHFLLTLPNDDSLKRSILVYCIIEAEEYGEGASFIGEYGEYENDEDMQTWLETSITLLLTDKERLTHLTNLCAKMPASKVPVFVDQIIRNGLNDIHDMQKTAEAKRWKQTLLTHLEEDEIDVPSGAAYKYAYQLLQTYNHDEDIAKKKRYLTKAAELFERCIRYDSGDEKATQMYVVTLTELAQAAMEENDMEEANRLMEKMTELY